MMLLLRYIIFDLAFLLPAADKSTRDSKSNIKTTNTEIITHVGFNEFYRSPDAARPPGLGGIAPQERLVGLFAV